MSEPSDVRSPAESNHLHPLSLSRQENSRRRCDELMGLVYDDLRRLATRLLRGESREPNFSSTDLVHEAYTRLVDQSRVDWRGRTHFFAIAAQAMRRILIDRARHCGRAKHGGDWKQIPLDSCVVIASRDSLEREDLLALDVALTKLFAIDHREGQAVVLRFVVGLSHVEIAEALDVSVRSVARDLLHARSWLRRELGRQPVGAETR